jgi:HD-GYP domain-containing protein (c-di-GMP phosphodiesterase class II)
MGIGGKSAHNHPTTPTEPIELDPAAVSVDRTHRTDQPGRIQKLKGYLLQKWGGFLVLAGVVDGGRHEKLVIEVEAAQRLNQQLLLEQERLNQANLTLSANAENLQFLNREFQQNQEEISRANAALKNYSDNLEAKVNEQTEELNRANASLKDYGENLELKVKERTEELEKSKQSIESLKAKVEETLYSTMDASVAKLLIAGPLRNEKHNVSVLFSDLVGFTSYSEQNPPEIVIRDLNLYIGDMEPILLVYRGHIDRYMGDGIMCEFGAPLDYETHRILSVLAAVKMQEKAAKMKYPWEMRIGVSSGSAITGLIGNKRRYYTAIGDVVNLSARLQMACTPGKVLIDGYTYEVVGRFIDARKKRDLPIKEIPEAGTELRLEELHERVAADPGNALNYFHIGQIHFELNEQVEALQYFEKALQRDPGEMNFKLAYAEAGTKIRENEKINIRGRRQRIEAYEVIGLKDPFEDRHKVSQKFSREYRYVLDLLQIPSDVTLPVEALDGSIGHSKMVAIFSYALATYFGLPDTEKMDILQAGFLADIGKEIIPHHLLNRMGGLSSRETDIVKTHPVEGARSLRKMGYENQNMIRIVYHSHENFNGTGYPDGLKQEEIPLGSRIVAAADAYDAIISWRPYRDAWERNAALDEIGRGAGKGLYDPKVVAALIKIMS